MPAERPRAHRHRGRRGDRATSRRRMRSRNARTACSPNASVVPVIVVVRLANRTRRRRRRGARQSIRRRQPRTPSSPQRMRRSRMVSPSPSVVAVAEVAGAARVARVRAQAHPQPSSDKSPIQPSGAQRRRLLYILPRASLQTSTSLGHISSFISKSDDVGGICVKCGAYTKPIQTRARSTGMAACCYVRFMG